MRRRRCPRLKVRAGPSSFTLETGWPYDVDECQHDVTFWWAGTVFSMRSQYFLNSYVPGAVVKVSGGRTMPVVSSAWRKAMVPWAYMVVRVAPFGLVTRRQM